MLGRLFKALVRVLIALTIIASITFLAFNFYYEQLSKPLIFAEGDFTYPAAMPDIDVTFNGEPTPGRITFVARAFRGGPLEFLSSEKWDYLIEYDTALQQVVYAERAWYSGTTFERHSDDLLSYYHYPFWQHHVAYSLTLSSGGLQGVSGGQHVLLDGNYNEIRRIGQPWNTDFHDLHVLENGNILYLGAVIREEAPSEFLECTEDCFSVSQPIYEITPEGDIIWEWDPYDVYAIEDTRLASDVGVENLSIRPMNIYDFIHTNTISIAPDGDYIISFRQYSDIIKLDPETKEIMWHLGNSDSPYNEFEFINDPFNGVSAQHQPNLLENGNLLVYDNGTDHTPQVTRVVEYELDLENMTATLIWEYTTPEQYYFPWMGGTERLPNGNTIISFPMRQPGVVEVTPDGEVVMEMSFTPRYFAYRASFYSDEE